MKKIIYLIIFIVSTFLLMGCWDSTKPSISIDNDDIEIRINEVFILRPKVKDHQEPFLIFSSSDPSIFEVDELGIVTPVGLGEAYATILLSGTEVSITVNIKIIEALPILSFSDNAYTMKENENLQLELFANGVFYQGEIEWSSLDSCIADVDQTGLVMAYAVGKTTITAKVNTQEVAVDVFVEKAIEEEITSITILGKSEIELGQSLKFTTIANIVASFEVDWSSDNEQVASISSNGLVIAENLGTTIIRAVLKDNPLITTSLEVTVINPKLQVTIHPESTMYVGAVDHSLIIRDNRGIAISRANCQFTSSNQSVANISTNGVITAFNVGNTLITVTYGNATGAVLLTVIAAPIENSRNTIIQKALAEEGYVEGANNNTKYGAWYGLNYNPWCAMFVSWCAYQAGIPTTVIPKYAAVSDGLSFYQSKGSDFYKSYEQTQNGEYIPQCGDIIFFKSNGASHTGLVIKVVGDILYTIEGNTSNKVALRYYYYKNYDKITGYGIPAYLPSSSSIIDFSVASATYGGGVSTV